MTAPAIITVARLYMVFDTVALAITGGIIQCHNDEVARRSFSDALSAKDSPFASHAADYDLIYIGTLDSLGNIRETNAAVISRGADWVAANAKPELVK